MSYLKELLLNENVDIEVIHAIESLIDNNDLINLEFELIYDVLTHPLYTEKFFYSDGNLSQKDYYTDDTLTEKIWQLNYSYNVSGEITQKDIKKISTGVILRIAYTWVAGNLDQKDRSWV